MIPASLPISRDADTEYDAEFRVPHVVVVDPQFDGYEQLATAAPHAASPATGSTAGLAAVETEASGRSFPQPTDNSPHSPKTFPIHISVPSKSRDPVHAPSSRPSFSTKFFTKEFPVHSVRPVVAARASCAFSSLAVTVVMAALTILALAFGTVQNTNAESAPGTGPGGPPTQAPFHLHESR
jgi:hypothetical protein